MHHHGWITRGMLDFLAHTPLRHLLGGGARYYRDAAGLLDAWAFALWGLALAAAAVLVWRGRSRLVAPQHEYRLWVALIILVFGGSALWYSLISAPETDTNFWALAPSIARLPAPVYTDRYTAFDLAYLSAYHDSNIRSVGYLPDKRVRSLLARRRGCFLLSQPHLTREAEADLAGTSTAVVLNAVQHPPAGWTVVKRVAATENPYASIVVLCAHA